MKRRTTKRKAVHKTPKTKIWIVEDNDFFQKCLIELINNETDLVCSHSFNSCEKALPHLELDKPPNIILLDIELPGMSGLEEYKNLNRLLRLLKLLSLLFTKIVTVSFRQFAPEPPVIY